MYPSLRLIDAQNQVDKTLVFQQKGQLINFKLDIEPNSLVSQFFFFKQFRNSNTDVTKNIVHTSPMVNIGRITLWLNNNVVSCILYLVSCIDGGRSSVQHTNMNT